MDTCGDRNRGHYKPRSEGRYDSRHHSHGSFSRPRSRFHQPDYKINPDKWTKYSLEDTCTYGDSFNRSVALDFISELRKRKAGGKSEDVATSSDDSAKIEFHKPKTGSSSSQDRAEDSSGKRKNYGSVYRMSEYVVGMAKKPKPRHHTKTNENTKTNKYNLALKHLAEDHLDSDETMDVDPSAETGKADLKSPARDTDQLGTEDSSSSSKFAKDRCVSSDSSVSSNVDNADHGKPQFTCKFGKGKHKRKIRARQVDDDEY